MFVLCLVSPSAQAGRHQPTNQVPNWKGLLEEYHEALDSVTSDQSARDLFITAIGPAMGLHDSAAAIGAKGIPAKLATELMIPELATSAQNLVASLATWRLAERTTQSVETSGNGVKKSFTVSQSQIDWLSTQERFSSVNEIIQPQTSEQASTSEASKAASTLTSLAVTATRLAQAAAQQAMDEWWLLKSWKDRVRVARGQSRLCGTWQWVIHNHKHHHQEQKISLIFPPPGVSEYGIPGLTEVVVLGDAVYLRWEANGQTQEDSLLFSNEGQRLEGTFVNSQGGWGSITGKRTANCILK